MTDVTQILNAIEQGDPSAAEQLLPLVYDELRKLAAAQDGPGEAGPDASGDGAGPRGVFRLVDVEKAQHWDSRGHFFAAAAEAMRRILVENARRKQQPKRGGDMRRESISTMSICRSNVAVTISLALDEALTKLAEDDPEARNSSNCGSSLGSPSTKRPKRLASRTQPLIATGLMPEPGCVARWPAD